MTSVIEPLGICNHKSFWNEARFQRACAVCGTTRGTWDAHHVVYKQTLRDLYGLRDDGLYDSANALRLCNLHHSRHHQRSRPVKTTELTELSIRYAFHVMGAYAADWLRAYYDDSEPDARIVKLES